MKPYRIDWLSSTAANAKFYISVAAPVIGGQPLAFTNHPNLPPDNVRPITLSGNGTDLSGITFVITGTTETGSPLTENLVGPTAAATVTSANVYAKVVSIVPSASSVGTVQIGYGDSANSYTMPYNNDVYNKQSMFALSIENIAGGAQIIPQVTADVPGQYVDAVWVPAATRNWFEIVPTETNPGFATPIVANTQIQYLSWPQSAIRCAVGNNVGASFSVITIQQGGKY